MKIAFVGAQCSGKTSTLLYVMSELKAAGCNDVTMIQELARSCPYPINQSGTFDSQIWMMLTQILTEQQLQHKWRVVLSDRSVIDPFIYSSYLANGGYIDKSALDFLADVMDAWIKHAPYDAIFLFEPFPIKADVDRPADADFQSEINRRFHIFLHKNPSVIPVAQPDKFSRREFVLMKIKELMAQ
jgi:hypothetical protein